MAISRKELIRKFRPKEALKVSILIKTLAGDIILPVEVSHIPCTHFESMFEKLRSTLTKEKNSEK